MTTLLPDHRKVLEALADDHDGESDFGYMGFARIMSDTGMDRKTVRRICRHLARKGLTRYCSGLWSEDGEPRGAGYCCTDDGFAALGRKAMEDAA